MAYSKTLLLGDVLCKITYFLKYCTYEFVGLCIIRIAGSGATPQPDFIHFKTVSFTTSDWHRVLSWVKLRSKRVFFCIKRIFLQHTETLYISFFCASRPFIWAIINPWMTCFMTFLLIVKVHPASIYIYIYIYIYICICAVNLY